MDLLFGVILTRTLFVNLLSVKITLLSDLLLSLDTPAISNVAFAMNATTISMWCYANLLTA